MLGDLVISINEDGDHVGVDAMSRQQRAQHPEETTTAFTFPQLLPVCVCVCAEHHLSPVQIVGSVSCYNSYWNIDDVIDQQLEKKHSGFGHKLGR